MSLTLRPEDLMIGNLLQTDLGLVRVVGIPYAKQLEFNPFPHQYEERRAISKIEPILLNEEWINKLGFGPDMANQLVEHTKIFDFRIGPFDRILLRTNGEVEITSLSTLGNGVIQQYVHQFQNFYFAMTGHTLELDIHNWM